MKRVKIMVSVFLFFSLMLGAQEVKVISLEYLTLPRESHYFHPVFNPAGDKLSLTSENYEGLKIYDFNSGRIVTVSEATGAGQKSVFSPDGNKIYFTEQRVERSQKSTQLKYFDLVAGTSGTVTHGGKESGHSSLRSWWSRLFTAGPKGSGTLNHEALTNGKWDYPFVTVESGKLMFFKDEKGKLLDPLSVRYYMQASISPDGKRIVAYAVGVGAFACRTDGSDVRVLGQIEAPVWLNDDIIVGMVTRDDGHNVTGSILQSINVKSGGKQMLTIGEMAILYPSVSKEKQQIVGHTPNGEIALITYKIIE